MWMLTVCGIAEWAGAITRDRDMASWILDRENLLPSNRCRQEAWSPLSLKGIGVDEDLGLGGIVQQTVHECLHRGLVRCSKQEIHSSDEFRPPEAVFRNTRCYYCQRTSTEVGINSFKAAYLY